MLWNISSSASSDLSRHTGVPTESPPSAKNWDIYVYKLTVDNGGAPCVFENRLSLAICKPQIRRTACEGTLIFGFGGKDHRERLIYIARVTDKLQGRLYYQRREFARRPDCIYRAKNGAPVRKQSAKFHFDSDQRIKDVGLYFENAFVLLSDDFRYFGHKGTDDFKKRFPKVRYLIESLSQGHRRFHSPELRDELLKLKAEVWEKHRLRKIGSPSDADRSQLCNGGSLRLSY